MDGEGLSIRLNPKYISVEKDEPWKFHPYTGSEIPQANGRARAPVVKPTEHVDLLSLIFILSLVATIQAILAAGSYSGEGNAPMHGDFEAQRHWMEITLHLPATQWYVNSTENDLLYWGLDYPPLTAYHSYLMGLTAHLLNSSWVALNSSRGIEEPSHKMFMRVTAVLPFYLIYFPTIIYFILYETKRKDLSRNHLLIISLMYPGVLAIDNAHFQYNSVSLGFFLFSFLLLINRYFLLGSIMFVMALNYKQMELYHALPIFTFILARSMRRPLSAKFFESVMSVSKVSVTVMLTFAIIWLPFISGGGIKSVLDVLGRIFPFYRGLYEDKVASIWCAFSFVFRMNKIVSLETQVKISAVCVLLAAFPSLLILFLRPTTRNFSLSLFISSLVFFMFSFQVHEKSILLAAAPSLLLLPDYPFVVSWFLHITNTSMFSLCLKDGTGSLLTLFFSYYVICSIVVRAPGKLHYAAYHMSCLIAIMLCVAEWTLSPPQRYPHIFSHLNAMYSCSHFLIFTAYFYFELVRNEYNLFSKKAL